MTAQAEQKNDPTKSEKTLIGRVVSDARDKTGAVEIEWSTRHNLYSKVLKRKSKLHFHDENNSASTGDMVRIKQCRPFSKTKTWVLVEIVEKGIKG